MSTLSTTGAATGATSTASAASGATPEQIKQAAQKFESMLLRQMLAESRKVDFGNTLFTNEGTKTFREMQDSNFADTVAKRGTLGFARMIEAQLSRQTQTTSSTTAQGGAK